MADRHDLNALDGDRDRRPSSSTTPAGAGHGGPGQNPLSERSSSAATLLLKAVHGVLVRVSEPRVVLTTILDQAVQLTDADRGALIEVGESGELEFSVLEHYSPGERRALTGPSSRTVLSLVARSGDELVVEDVLSDPRFMRRESVQNLRASSTLSMPIREGDRTRAIIHLEKSTARHFEPEHVELMRSLAKLAGRALQATNVGRNAIEERDRLLISTRHLRAETEESRRALTQTWQFSRFVGRTPQVQDLESKVRKAAATGFPVLLIGESGTGKNILARVIHHASARAESAFVTVFCPSLEPGLLETELFGHRRGAFTGAHESRDGKIAAGEGGTIFLDEISALPLALQPKLLRLLQEQTYERVGDAVERKANVRFVAATNKNLEEEVLAGRFRRDLYERLNYARISIPPLRERRADIALLLRDSLDRHDAGRWVEITDAAIDELTGMNFEWPGNVRQVEQLAARIIMERFDRPVDVPDLAALFDGMMPSGRRLARAGVPEAVAKEFDLHGQLRAAEQRVIAHALEQFPGLTRAQLAKKLNISQAALYKKLRDHGFNA